MQIPRYEPIVIFGIAVPPLQDSKVVPRSLARLSDAEKLRRCRRQRLAHYKLNKERYLAIARIRKVEAGLVLVEQAPPVAPELDRLAASLWVDEADRNEIIHK